MRINVFAIIGAIVAWILCGLLAFAIEVRAQGINYVDSEIRSLFFWCIVTGTLSLVVAIIGEIRGNFVTWLDKWLDKFLWALIDLINKR